MTLAAKPFAAAVNHLLARESWARDRLIPYAGKTARLEISPVTLVLLVQPDGYLAAVEAHDARRFDVSIALSSGADGGAFDAAAAFLQGGQAAVMKHVKIDGDAEFATQIAKLAEHLRWEPEEDLSSVVGDAAAHRIATVVRSAGARAPHGPQRARFDRRILARRKPAGRAQERARRFRRRARARARYARARRKTHRTTGTKIDVRAGGSSRRAQ
ncbi:Ubiquinone biosynthesis accessory factor UbiJ [Burkholderia pseudomallei]